MIRCKKFHLKQRAIERGYTLEEVAGCIVARHDNGDITVDTESSAYPTQYNPLRKQAMQQTKTGPGTHLKKMLEAWGIHAKKGGGCKCKDMEVRMNRLGIACKEPANLKMIIDHLQAEAKKRKLPFVRKAGELLVLRAVKRFEKES